MKILTIISDCVILSHADAKILAIHQVTDNYFKIAPNRTGGAGAGATLLERDNGSASDVEPEESDTDIAEK
jgi:hypothetical protein